MFRLRAAPLVERFELVLLDVETAAGPLQVPIVGGWLELRMTLLRIPDVAEGRAFFGLLRLLVEQARALHPGIGWYLIHKAPGLKLRFQVGLPDAALLEVLIGTVAGWRLEWLRLTELGSVFDQSELLPATFRAEVERLLSHAADAHVAAVLDDRRATTADWARLLVQFLAGLGIDEWLAYAALSRLRRLRGVPLEVEGEGGPLFDPSALFARPAEIVAPGFAESVALLQTINLILNIWAVDAPTQREILDSACAATRPSLMDLPRA